MRELLRQIDGTQGTVAFLDLLDSVYKAYVCPKTPSLERLKYAVDAPYFIRYWKASCQENEVPKANFITKNSWDGLEINLAMMLRLIIDREAHNIHQQTSQNCEGFFRKERSFSSLGSTMTNFDALCFTKRAHKIAYEEKIYNDLDDITFPKLDKRGSAPMRQPEEYDDDDIKEAISSGIMMAQNRALSCGITNFDIDLSNFLKPPKNSKKDKNEMITVDDDDDDEEEEPYVVKDPFEVGSHQYRDEEEEDERVLIQNLEFTQETTGNLSFPCMQVRLNSPANQVS